MPMLVKWSALLVLFLVKLKGELFFSLNPNYETYQLERSAVVGPRFITPMVKISIEADQ